MQILYEIDAKLSIYMSVCLRDRESRRERDDRAHVSVYLETERQKKETSARMLTKNIKLHL